MGGEKTPNKKLPKNIRAGHVLLVIASVMFFLDALVQLAGIISDIVENSVVWNDPTSIISFLKMPLLLVFFVFGGLCGIAFVKDKSILAGWVGLVAALCLLFFLFDFFDSVIRLIKTPDWGRFLSSMLSVQIDTTIYFIGWFMSKDYFED